MMKQNEQWFFYYGEKDYFNHKDEWVKRRVAFAGTVINNQLQIGIAACSEKDRYVKKTGRNIAIGRAVKIATIVIFIDNMTDGEMRNEFVKACKAYCDEREPRVIRYGKGTGWLPNTREAYKKVTND